jgi:hypothetical protein
MTEGAERGVLATNQFQRSWRDILAERAEVEGCADADGASGRPGGPIPDLLAPGRSA